MDTTRRGFLLGILATPAIIPFANLDKLPSLSLRRFVYTDKDFTDLLSKRLSFSDMVRNTLRSRMVDLHGNIDKNNPLYQRIRLNSRVSIGKEPYSNYVAPTLTDGEFRNFPGWVAEYDKVKAEYPDGVPFKPLTRLYEPDEAPWDIAQRPENNMAPHQYREYMRDAAKVGKL